MTGDEVTEPYLDQMMCSCDTPVTTEEFPGNDKKTIRVFSKDLHDSHLKKVPLDSLWTIERS